MYWQYRGQTLEWLTADTEELYKQNLKRQRSLLAQHGWLDRKITYQFNSLGFRSDPIDKQGLLFLGCSHTIGIGLPWAETWPKLVADQLALACYNFGQGGASMDTIFRLAERYLGKIPAKKIIVCATYPDRKEIITAGGGTLQFWGRDSTESKYRPFYDRWLENPENGRLNKIKSELAIRQICRERGCDLTWIDQTAMPAIDLARDLQHRGTESNRLFSEKIVAMIRSENVSAAEQTPMMASLDQQ